MSATTSDEATSVGTTDGHEPPLYVPDEFEAAHLEDARRIVRRRSGRRPSARHGRATVPEDEPRPLFARLRRLAAVIHVVAAANVAVVAAATRTWLVGLVVLVYVGLSFAVALGVLHFVRRIEDEDRATPGPAGPGRGPPQGNVAG